MSDKKKVFVDTRQKSIDNDDVIKESYVYEGKAGRVGDTYCIIYDQIEDETEEIIKNIIKVEGEHKVTRTSKGTGQAGMVFENGKVTKCSYKTPYGVINMSFFSKNVQCIRKPEEFEIVLEYILSIDNVPTTEVFMRIRAQL